MITFEPEIFRLLIVLVVSAFFLSVAVAMSYGQDQAINFYRKRKICVGCFIAAGIGFIATFVSWMIRLSSLDAWICFGLSMILVISLVGMLYDQRK